MFFRILLLALVLVYNSVLPGQAVRALDVMRAVHKQKLTESVKRVQKVDEKEYQALALYCKNILNYYAQRQATIRQALTILVDNMISYDAIANGARQSFAETTIPGIAERFTRLGAQKSSSFQNALASAGADLNQSLAVLRVQHQQQQQQQLIQLLQGLVIRYPDLFNNYKPFVESVDLSGLVQYLIEIADDVENVTGKMAVVEHLKQLATSSSIKLLNDLRNVGFVI